MNTLKLYIEDWVQFVAYSVFNKDEGNLPGPPQWGKPYPRDEDFD
jgi:hypothetical protein